MIFGLTQILLALGVSLQILGGGRQVLRQGMFLVLVGLVFPAVGAFIVSRRPRHPIGWIYLCFGATMSTAMFSISYADYGLRKAPGSLPAPQLGAWLGTWLWIPGLILLATFSFLVFPDGRLPSRRWRSVAWISAAALAASFVHGSLLAREAPIELLRGNSSEISDITFLVAFGLAALGMVASVASLFVRLRRATGEERQQLKWFLAAALLFAAGIPFAFDPLSGLPGADSISEGVGFAIPLATGVAVLRHRLYDIDLLINRTLVYGALTAALGAVYFALVIVLQAALGNRVADEPLTVAASTLAVAALFRPARARIQSIIDRRFNRRRYDAQQTVEAFSARLRDEIDLETLTSDLLVVVRGTVQPQHASVWLLDPGATR